VKRNLKNDSWGDKKQSLTAVLKRNFSTNSIISKMEAAGKRVRILQEQKKEIQYDSTVP
jgi:hypothetical protein